MSMLFRDCRRIPTRERLALVMSHVKRKRGNPVYRGTIFRARLTDFCDIEPLPRG